MTASLRPSIAGGRTRYSGAIYTGRQQSSQSRWTGNPSEARWRRQLLTTLTHNRYLVEAPEGSATAEKSVRDFKISAKISDFSRFSKISAKISDFSEDFRFREDFKISAKISDFARISGEISRFHVISGEISRFQHRFHGSQL